MEAVTPVQVQNDINMIRGVMKLKIFGIMTSMHLVVWWPLLLCDTLFSHSVCVVWYHCTLSVYVWCRVQLSIHVMTVNGVIVCYTYCY